MIQLIAKMSPFGKLRGTSGAKESASRHDVEERRDDTSRSLSLFWRARLQYDDHDEAIPVMVVQISPGGLRVKHIPTPTPGTMVTVDLPGVAPLRGEARWAENGRFGVQLVEPIDVINVMRSHRAATGSPLGVADEAEAAV